MDGQATLCGCAAHEGVWFRAAQPAVALTKALSHEHPLTPVSISPVEDIVADMRAGRIVILVDEEDRENEGDLVLAADHVTPEAINFMARFGRGLICLTLTRERCEFLKLPPWQRATAPCTAPRSPCPSRQPKA